MDKHFNTVNESLDSFTFKFEQYKFTFRPRSPATGPYYWSGSDPVPFAAVFLSHTVTQPRHSTALRSYNRSYCPVEIRGAIPAQSTLSSDKSTASTAQHPPAALAPHDATKPGSSLAPYPDELRPLTSTLSPGLNYQHASLLTNSLAELFHQQPHVSRKASGRGGREGSGDAVRR